MCFAITMLACSYSTIHTAPSCAPQLLSFWAHNPGIDATCAFTLHTLTATRSLFGTKTTPLETHHHHFCLAELPVSIGVTLAPLL